MPVKVITTEVGHSLAHEGPHTITFHYPGWNIVESFREGDAAVLGRLTSIYPRFGPFAQARKVRRTRMICLVLLSAADFL